VTAPDGGPASVVGALPVAPSLDPVLRRAGIDPRVRTFSPRVVGIGVLAIGLGVLASVVAVLLGRLIDLVTNLAYHGQWSVAAAEPDGHAWGWWTVLVPVLGGLIVGLMARYGSAAIRGHGIPEAMEQVLTNRSRIPPRMVLLKPLSAAIAIGTGGPFGAEGPIIATGGALGSLIGQLLRTTATERKTLLAAGAAAGMAATFGTPVAAVMLAIELLLFEFRPRSFLPVALAAATATGCRFLIVGQGPAFVVATVAIDGPGVLVGAALVGLAGGVMAALATRAVYAIEDGFAKLPVHWMWWPMLGGLVVGLVGLVEPRALGVGYRNIADLGSGNLLLGTVCTIGVWKFVAWSLSLGSGTSGGTLAPLFTIGGCCGALAGAGLAVALPTISPEPGLAALIGMAATFAGASHAVLASAIFVSEATHQPLAVIPLLIGCTVGYVVARLAQRTSIMTEKIARRGVAVPGEYEADALACSQVAQRMTAPVETLGAAMTVGEAQARFVAGGGRAAYPVVDDAGLLVGVVTRRELLADGGVGRRVGDLVRREPTVIQPDCTVREAVDLLLTADVGRLVVVDQDEPRRILGILSRGDVLGVHRQTSEDDHDVGQALDTDSVPVVAVPRRRPSERAERRLFIGRIRTVQWLRRVRHPTRVYLRRMRGAELPHPPRPALAVVMAAWVGALLAIGFVGWMADAAHAPLMIASFGASAVLLFGMPDSPFSQPRNTIIGHLLAAVIGMAAANLIGENWMAMALAVATALGVMKLARAVHPPAGSTAIIALHLHPGPEFLILPVLVGSLLLVALAALYNNVFEHRRYPLRWT